MKKPQINLMQILQDYGSVAAYNQEQARCGLAQIEAELATNQIKNTVQIQIAPTIDLHQPAKFRQSHKISFKTIKLLRLRLFGAKA